jgi:hypothetical protein
LLSGPGASSATRAPIVESRDAPPVCCGKYPMQPVARPLLRDKDVLRWVLDHCLQQFLATARTGAQKRSRGALGQLAGQHLAPLRKLVR